MNQGQIFAATAGTMAAATARAESWKHVGTIGRRQFVLVDPEVASDAATLKRAANAVCEPGKVCVVVFWSEETAVPSKMPMTLTQQQAAVAQYLRNPASGHEELLMKCRADGPVGVKCLR